MWTGACVRLGCAVIGWQSAAARPGYAINAVRRFGRRQLTSAKHQSLLPVQEVEGTSQGVRDLLRPFAFVVAVTGASFTGAAIIMAVRGIPAAGQATADSIRLLLLLWQGRGLPTPAERLVEPSVSG